MERLLIQLSDAVRTGFVVYKWRSRPADLAVLTVSPVLHRRSPSFWMCWRAARSPGWPRARFGATGCNGSPTSRPPSTRRSGRTSAEEASRSTPRPEETCFRPSSSSSSAKAARDRWRPCTTYQITRLLRRPPAKKRSSRPSRTPRPAPQRPARRLLPSPPIARERESEEARRARRPLGRKADASESTRTRGKCRSWRIRTSGSKPRSSGWERRCSGRAGRSSRDSSTPGGEGMTVKGTFRGR